MSETAKPSRKLSDRQGMLAADAGESYRRHQRSHLDATKFYIKAGRVLLEAKAECRHGEFGAVIKHAGIPQSTARRTMKIAKIVGDDPEQIIHVDNFGIRMTMELIKHAEKWEKKPYAEAAVAEIGGPFELMKLLAVSGPELVELAFEIVEEDFSLSDVPNNLVYLLYAKLQHEIAHGNSPYDPVESDKAMAS